MIDYSNSSSDTILGNLRNYTEKNQPTNLGYAIPHPEFCSAVAIIILCARQKYNQPFTA